MIKAYRTGDTLDIPALTAELAETTLFAQGMVSNIHSQLKTKEEQEQFLDQLTAQWETQGLLPHLTPELRDTVLALTGNCPPAHERMTRPDTAGTPAKTREELDKGLGRMGDFKNANDPEARKLAMEKAMEYVTKNPGGTYGFDKYNPTPPPGEGVIDCSGLMRACIIAAGYPDPYFNPATHASLPGIPKENGNGFWGNGVALLVSNPLFKEKPMDNLSEGDMITFKTGRTEQKGERGQFDHIGMVKEVHYDEMGNIAGFEYYHSGSSKYIGPTIGTYFFDNFSEAYHPCQAFSWDNLVK